MKRLALLFVLMTAAMAASKCRAQGPSFNCSQADSVVARAICDDAELSADDRAMASAYSAVLSSLPPQQVGLMKATQRAWWRERQKTCALATGENRKTCIQTRLRGRTAELNGLLAQNAKPQESRMTRALSQLSSCFAQAAIPAVIGGLFELALEIFGGQDLNTGDILSAAGDGAVNDNTIACLKETVKQLMRS